MQMMHRVTLVLIVVLVLLFGSMVVSQEVIELQGQWEMIQTEKFLSKLCRTGQCTYEEYASYYNCLNYFGTETIIRMEEYQKEQDLDGKIYYYLVSWEEIRTFLLKKSSYMFQQESIIRITVQRKSRSRTVQCSYYDVVERKEIDNGI